MFLDEPLLKTTTDILRREAKITISMTNELEIK